LVSVLSRRVSARRSVLTAVLPGRPISASMLMPFSVARVGRPELGDGGRAPCQSTPTGRL
jgi:hypothetical protein